VAIKKWSEITWINIWRIKIWQFAQSNSKLWCNHTHRICIFTLQSHCQITEDGDVRGWQMCPWSSCIPRYLEPHI